METSDTINLTLNQKIRLAANVFAIYWPLRFYINLDSLDWAKFRTFIVYIWLSEIPITIALFTFWLVLTEWLENRIFSNAGGVFRRSNKLPAQLATLLIAGMLSVGFDWAFFGYLHTVRMAVEKTDSTISVTPPLQARPETSPNSGRPNGQGRRKGVTTLTIMALLMAYYLAANRRGDKIVAQLQVNTEQLKREASQAQFEALKNQVNPHFLFNSLSILSSLVDINPKLSIRFINHLSKAYRYILEQRDTEQVSLKTELDFLNAYCFLLNIRFDDKLQLVNTVSETEATRFGIAPLTLQMLLENAVKHNQMSRRHPLIVSLTTQSDYLLVSNPIQLRLPDDPSTEVSTGIGLVNITNRYRLLTARPVLISQADNTFVVSIPLLAL